MENQSAIRQRDWDFLDLQGVIDPRNLVLLPRLMEGLDLCVDLWTGYRTLYIPEVELAQHANHGQSENRPVGLRFPHRAERYQSERCPCSSPGFLSCRCVDEFGSRHVTLSFPGDAYFVYETWPMSYPTRVTLTRITKFVVTGQAPVTLELRNAPGERKIKQTKGDTRIYHS